MPNKAFITVEVEIDTDEKTGKDVERVFASYILPSMVHDAPPAVKKITWTRCEEIHDETGKIIFKVFPYRVVSE